MNFYRLLITMRAGVSKNKTALHPPGTRTLPTKTPSRGQFENPAYTPRGETMYPSANIPATKNTREESGRRFNRKGPRRASSKK